jgi:hypothetical protein
MEEALARELAFGVLFHRCADAVSVRWRDCETPGDLFALSPSIAETPGASVAADCNCQDPPSARRVVIEMTRGSDAGTALLPTAARR